MDDIIDAAQVMFEEDGISQETVNELRSVSPNLLLEPTCHCTGLDWQCLAFPTSLYTEFLHRCYLCGLL